MPGSLLAMVAQVSGTGVVAIATDKEIDWDEEESHRVIDVASVCVM
jgi:hypothetical protein